jgi:hypothetical protein
MNRRAFMKWVTGATLAAGCERLPLTPAIHTRRKSLVAPGNAWGTPWPAQLAGMMPAAAVPQGMLEIFLLGGLSPWETFYTVPELCRPDSGGPYAGQQWWTFQDTSALESPALSVPTWFGACGDGRPLYQPFATDSAGRSVNLGPFILALRDRPDMLARMRVWVLGHEIEPHEAAIPQAICGHRLSNPRLASLGTHLQRFYGERRPLGRTAPYSYAIAMSALKVTQNNATAATAIGSHPATARPLAIQLGAQSRLARQLPRGSTEGYRSELDAYVAHHIQRLQGSMGTGDFLGALRAPGVSDFSFARSAIANHDVLTELLTAERLAVDPVLACVSDPFGTAPGDEFADEVKTGLELASTLLTDPANAARYVQFLDSGLYTDPAGQGYDTHGVHVEQMAPNVMHLARRLTEIVNEPGEKDPSKLDLDRHFILLNTEFGRSPFAEVTPRNPGGAGTNHWPWGYVVIGFGGFVDEDRSGVIGAIDASSVAVDGLSPAEHRAAMLLAMGAWPFTPESFAVGDIRNVTSELDAAVWLKERVLGYST